MVNFVGFSKEDEDNLYSIYRDTVESFGEIKGEYYKIHIDGQVGYLRILDGVYTVYAVKEDFLESDQFSVDEKGNLFFDYEDCQIKVGQGEVRSYSKVHSISESIEIVKRINGVDVDGYDGIFAYVQYDEETDKRVILTYQQMYREEIKIYPARIQVPFAISYETRANATNNGSKFPRIKQSFSSVRVKYNENAKLFNYVTKKEFGKKEVLAKGALALQKSDEIVRYSKIIFLLPDQRAFTGFPYCAFYTQEDMNNFLEERGFRCSVPEYLIEIFNEENEEIRKFQDIFLAHRTYEKDIQKKTLDYR